MPTSDSLSILRSGGNEVRVYVRKGLVDEERLMRLPGLSHDFIRQGILVVLADAG